MKCNICDATLNPDEIKIHPEIKKFEPCRNCLEIISEVFEDGKDEDEISIELQEELDLE